MKFVKPNGKDSYCDFLTFKIDDKSYAFAVKNLYGVVANPKIRLLTNAPELCVGVMEVNKLYVPVIDLRLMLEKPNYLYPNRTCIIIVRVSFKAQEKLVGFIVDSVLKIQHVKINNIKKLPDIENKGFISSVIAEKDKIILPLNIREIINNEELITFLNQFWNTNYQDNNKNLNRRNKNGV